MACRETRRANRVVYDRGVVGFEQQQLSALVFGAIDREIVQAYSIGHIGQRGPMPARKSGVERAHERLFFETLRCVFRHPRVEIPDIPAIGDRHMTRVRPPFDESNTVLAEQSILACIVDKAGHEKILFRPFLEDNDRWRCNRRVWRGPISACEPRGRTMMGNCVPAEISENESFDRATSDNCPRVMLNVAGISSPSIPRSN